VLIPEIYIIIGQRRAGAAASEASCAPAAAQARIRTHAHLQPTKARDRLMQGHMTETIRPD